MTAELGEGTVSRLLGRLDRMLRAAVERMLADLGPDVAADPFRGLYISQKDAARLLDAWPGYTASPVQPSPADDLTESGHGEAGPHDAAPELAWLADAYDLSDFDLHVVLLALAPEVDLRYERVYAFLQDDVSRRRPTVDLALNLLCATPEVKAAPALALHRRRPARPPRRRAAGGRAGQYRATAAGTGAVARRAHHPRLLGYRSVDPVLARHLRDRRAGWSGRRRAGWPGPARGAGRPRPPGLHHRRPAVPLPVRTSRDGPSASLPLRSRLTSACHCSPRASVRRWPPA